MLEEYDDYLAFYPWKIFDRSDVNEFDIKISDKCYHEADTISKEVIDEIINKSSNKRR